MSTSNEGYFSTKDAPSGNGEYDAMLYVINQVLGGAHHCSLVRVVAVDGPSVDVQPLVNMTDGQGNAIAHGVVNGLRFVRMQGGDSAIIIDPKVGDTGLAVICDNDVSSAVATGDFANPGSMRRNDLADGFYLGGVLNGTPTQYIEFSDAGIKIHSPKTIELKAASVTVEANLVTLDAPVVRATGNVQVEGGATGTFSTPQGTVVTVKSGIITNIY